MDGLIQEAEASVPGGKDGLSEPPEEAGDVEMKDMSQRPPETCRRSSLVERDQRTTPTAQIQYKGVTMSVACCQGNLPYVVLLWGMASAQRVNIMMPDSEGNNPMHLAALAETPEVANFLMQQTNGVIGPNLPLLALKNSDGETPILRAAAAGHLSTIKYLMEMGSQITATDNSGNTVLHNAARNNKLWAMHYLVESAKWGMDENNLKTFLYAVDQDDHNCLEWACYQGHVQMADYLIRQGMDPNRKDARGRTCLHLAAKQLHVKTVRFLVTKMKMSPYDTDDNGKNAFTYAHDAHDIAAALRTKPLPSAQEKDKPFRENQVRVPYMLSYSLLTCIIWLLPFFSAWYVYIPLVILGSLMYRQVQSLYTRISMARGDDFKFGVLGSWIMAHENFLGCWLGTFISFNLTYPVVARWPSSIAWSMQQEVGLRSLTHGLDASTVPTGLVVVMYLSFAMALLLWMDLVFFHPDPGIVPFTCNLYQELFDKVVTTANPPVQTKYCHTCLTKKPIRSKHCAACGFCIARMDHHCIWLDNCVGYKNHRRFMVFVFLHVVSVILFVGMGTSVLHQAMHSELNPGSRSAARVITVLFLRPVFPLFLQTLFALLCSLGLSALLLEQSLSIIRNVTTNERINGRRYPWVTDSQGRTFNRFDRGYLSNVLEFIFSHGNKYGRDYLSLYEIPDAAPNLKHRLQDRCCSHPGHSPSTSNPTDGDGHERHLSFHSNSSALQPNPSSSSDIV